MRLHLIIDEEEARCAYDALARNWHTSPVVQELVEKLGGFIRECGIPEDPGDDDSPAEELG